MVKIVPKTDSDERSLLFEGIKNNPGVYKFTSPSTDLCRIIVIKTRTGSFLRLHFNGENLYLLTDDIYNESIFTFQKVEENLVIG